MKNKLMYYLPLLMLILFTGSTFGQTARLQVIHNAADPAADSVDVYLNGTLLLDNFKFRTATPFIDAPAGTMINVGVAGPNSTSASDTLVNFELTLTPAETYVAIANGVLNPGSFASNPDGVSTAFTLFIKTMAKESGTGGNVDFAILHGSTDAPSVDIYARNVAQLADNAGYSAMTDYLSVPAESYLVDIKDSTSSVLVGTFDADLSGLSGGAAIVFASGFLTPSANQDGAGFGVYAALPTGAVVEFEPVTTARLQVIHNAADPAADSVDVYLNGTLLLDNFKFRTATPFIDAPAGTMINVGVAGPNSTSASDTLVNFELTLTPAETYVVIANGVLNPGSFAPNPDGVSTVFTLFIKTMAKEAGTGSNVDVAILHGSTDAPSVDIYARNVEQIVDNAGYSAMTDYLSAEAENYFVDVKDSTSTILVGTFRADLSGLAGSAAIVFASGFLTPSANQDGASFGLYGALPNGAVVEFEPVTTARLQVIHNAADPAADSVDVYLNGTLLLDNFKFRTATPFIDAPAGTMINVGVAGPNSTSASDTLVNFELTLTPAETYVAIANGVLNPGSFASNPDGVSTAFTLFIKTMARETAVDANNVEIIGVHGATDAPTVDIIARGVATLIDDVKYGEISDYIGVPPLTYTIDITPGNDNVTIVASYQADLSGLQGGTAVVFASGFLVPDSNQDGKSFGLFAALTNGTVVEFSPVTGVTEENGSVPSGYQLSQNYPNPFNPVTKISFAIPAAQLVTVKIYNVLGNEVETLFAGLKNAGVHDFNFSADNLASGVYYYTMKAGNFSSTKKMMLIR